MNLCIIIFIPIPHESYLCQGFEMQSVQSDQFQDEISLFTGNTHALLMTGVISVAEMSS